MLLHLAGRSELVEGALRHPREHVDQRIQTVLLVLLGERDHLEAKGQEGAVEKPVHQKHLAWKKIECRRSARSLIRLGRGCGTAGKASFVISH